MSHRGKPKTQSIRAMLRKEAEERQAEYNKLTLQQKLDRLPPAPAAKRQRAKLLALAPAPQTIGMGAMPPPGWEGLIGKTDGEIKEHFSQKVRHGIQDIKNGNVSSHEDVKTRLKAKDRHAQEKK